MDGTMLVRQFELSHKALQMNLEGLTHENSLIRPAPGGNCLNWVVGHLVATRVHMLQALGEPAPRERAWSAEEIAVYDRGAEPLEDAARAQRLEKLIEDFATFQELLLGKLRELSAADLAREGKRGSLGEELSLYSFHEAYHIGQAGLLRRLAGKSGAIH